MLKYLKINLDCEEFRKKLKNIFFKPIKMWVKYYKDWNAMTQHVGREVRGEFNRFFGMYGKHQKERGMKTIPFGIKHRIQIHRICDFLGLEHKTLYNDKKTSSVNGTDDQKRILIAFPPGFEPSKPANYPNISEEWWEKSARECLGNDYECALEYVTQLKLAKIELKKRREINWEQKHKKIQEVLAERYCGECGKTGDKCDIGWARNGSIMCCDCWEEDDYWKDYKWESMYDSISRRVTKSGGEWIYCRDRNYW